jgi:beta-glucosidase
MAGRPLTIESEVKMSDATIFSFHAGTMAGPGLADVLFGKVSPSGKLPVTFPRMAGQIPVYYNHKNTGRPASNITLIDDIPVDAVQTSIGFTSYHLDAGDRPLFSFGYGLSYTTFEYGAVRLSASTMGEGDTLTATCTVKNSGGVDASEVVQFYIRDRVASLVRPVRELKGFRKIALKAGEEATVSFDITAADLAFWRADGTLGAEPGEFEVWIAPDSDSGAPVGFTLQK